MSFLIRTLTPSNQGPTLITAFNLNCLLIPNTITVQVRTSTYESGGREDTNIQYIEACMFRSFKWDLKSVSPLCSFHTDLLVACSHYLLGIKNNTKESTLDSTIKKRSEQETITIIKDNFLFP